MKQRSLKEVTSKIGSGATPTGGNSVYQQQGVTFIRSQNIYDYNFKTEGLVFLSEAQASKLASVSVLSGDILLNITGDSIGRCCLVPDDILPARVNQHVAIIRHDPKTDVSPLYLLYYLNAPINKTALLNLANGGTRKALTKAILENFMIELPDLPIQRRIAAILGSLDDKIETNRRINRTLEGMAQALYKHWFVDFGPFQGGAFVESELGPIPAEWEVVKLETIVDVFLGGDWGKELPEGLFQNPTSIIRGTDFEDLQMGAETRCPMRYVKATSLAKRQLHPGDIVIENSVNAMTRAAGKSLFITDNILKRRSQATPFICASFCRMLRLHQPILAPLVYLQMNRQYQTGEITKFQNIASNGIANFQAERFAESFIILLPPPHLRDRLTSLAAYLISDAYTAENVALAATRDYLLPRLLSGEIEVEAAAEVAADALDQSAPAGPAALPDPQQLPLTLD